MTGTTNGAILTEEDLYTVFTECELMLNNRPLTYVDSNHGDSIRTTHFLNINPDELLVPGEVPLENVSLKRRW